MRGLMEREVRAAERAVTKGVRAAGVGLKTDWRRQVMAAGLGQGLARSVRNADFPAGLVQSISAAALVYSRSALVIDAHDRGALIKRSNINGDAGVFLAIPAAPDVQRMRGAFSGTGRGRRPRISPDGWEQRTGRRLRFIYRRGRPSLLIDDGTPLQRQRTDGTGWKSAKYAAWERRGRKTARTWRVIFVLVPQAKLRKKMDLDRDTSTWERKLPGLILSNWREGPNA